MHDRSALCLLGLGIAIAIAACTPRGSGSDARLAISAADRNLSALVAKGDVAGIAQLYAADAMVMPANKDVITGSSAISKLFQDAMTAGMHGLMIKITTVDVEGDLAVDTGFYAVLDANGGQMDYGKYVVTWKRENGVWKIYRDIWTTSLPPPPKAGEATAPPGAEGGAAPFAS